MIRARQVSSYPLHPVLLALFVWLSPYATNANELFFSTVAAAAIAIPACALAAFGLLWVLLRRPGAAGVATSLLLLFVAYYGHAFDALDAMLSGRLPNKLFMPAWGGVFLASVAVVLRSRSDLANLTKALNAGAAVLVLMPLLSLAASGTGRGSPGGAGTGEALLADSGLRVPVPDDGEFPDIYFLIFDRYASGETLEEIYGHDNSEFLDDLRGQGFYVADRSRANYGTTSHSLAATLNLTHLTSLSQKMGPGSNDWKPLVEMLRDNVVAHFLKANDYRYVHLGSWWEPTRASSLANENFVGVQETALVDVNRFNEFEWLLIEPTLLARFAGLLFGLAYEDERRHYHHERQKFEKLAALRREAAPLFVFAHFLVPHDPFVFFPDGTYKDEAERERMSRDKNYIDQLIYTTGKIRKLVKALLDKRPQPVIVIQADEGPYPTKDSERSRIDWRQATSQDLRRKYGILNAIYFPDRRYDDLYEDITPVNTFRVIFNRYFDQELPLLPDVSYSNYSDKDLYTFFDVTTIVE